MAYSINAKDYFRIKIYTGNGTDDRNITWDESSNMQPDMLWSKGRSVADHHSIYDAVRGSGKELRIESSAEYDRTNNIQALQTNGFQVGNDGQVNGNNDTYVSWGWKAGGSGSSNTDGSITSTVSANTTSGFSIVSWQADGGQTSNIGHGLGATPKHIIYKSRSASNAWYNWMNGQIDGTSHETLNLNSNSAKGSINTSTYGTPTNTTISNFGFTNGENMIAYCFVEKTGFSKFGSYVGHSGTQFLYLGFKPAWFLVKNANSSSETWHLYDNKRLGRNPDSARLYPSNTAVEAAETKVNLVSNGVIIQSSGDGHLNNANSFAYLAFAEAPLVGTNNVPCTAR
tara:strand:+ start:1182 stop:2207 length:1026 start_codon:yes stop_codon:yes gene_type:complete